MKFQRSFLIIVPHPDDEINVAGQLIYLLTQSHHQVYVTFTTNGDYSICDGRVRLKEAINALHVLGVDEKNIIFMGYGDDWKGEKHIYNSENEIVNQSMCNRKQTYGLETHQDYRFIKSGYHHEYTRKNYKQDLMDVILDLLVDVLIVVDFDTHPDHRCTSLMFEEVMGDILKKRDDYKPIVLKKFAYSGVWEGPEDYYRNPKEVTRYLSSRNPADANMSDPELEVPSYKWKDRIRFEAPKATQTLLVKENVIFKAAREHRTQIAKYNVSRICNADIVYWLRKTNSLSYQAIVVASSGEPKYINDFKIVDCLDVKAKQKGLSILGNCVWIPNKDDSQRMVDFYFLSPINVSCLSLYENFSLLDHIINGIISFDNGFCVNTGPLNNTGSETEVEFCMQYNVSHLSFQITEFIGDSPGLTEIEIYENKEKIDLSYITESYMSTEEIINIEFGFQIKIFFEMLLLKMQRFLFKIKNKFIYTFQTCLK